VVFHAIVSGLGPNDRRRHPASAGHDLTARTQPPHRYENCSRRADDGLGTLRAAAETEDVLPSEFEPSRLLKPTHELPAGELRKSGRVDEARAGFERIRETSSDPEAGSLDGMPRMLAAESRSA